MAVNQIQENYLALLQEVETFAQKYGRDPSSITVVAVSKGHAEAGVAALYEVGCRHFGENRIPEAFEKMASLPKEIHWHYIGALQSNKVNKVVGPFDLIHSVDSIELAKKLDARGALLKCNIPVLFQVNISGEPSKGGFSPIVLSGSIEEIAQLHHLQTMGLMTMAPNTSNEKIVRNCFSGLRNLRDDLSPFISLPHLSMGMSGDFKWGIAEGATILRIGSRIFN